MASSQSLLLTHVCCGRIARVQRGTNPPECIFAHGTTLGFLPARIRRHPRPSGFADAKGAQNSPSLSVFNIDSLARSLGATREFCRVLIPGDRNNL